MSVLNLLRQRSRGIDQHPGSAIPEELIAESADTTAFHLFTLSLGAKLGVNIKLIDDHPRSWIWRTLMKREIWTQRPGRHSISCIYNNGDRLNTVLLSALYSESLMPIHTWIEISDCVIVRASARIALIRTKSNNICVWPRCSFTNTRNACGFCLFRFIRN